MKTYHTMTAMMAALLLTGGAWAAEHPAATEQSAGGEHPAGSEHPKAKDKGLLDGQVFTGQLGKAGEEKGDMDKLVFKNGTFVSTACVEHGFQAAAYKCEEKDGVFTFTVKATNDAKETMSWSGTVKDGKVEATAVHQAESEKTDYWYKGALKKAEKPEPPATEHPQ